MARERLNIENPMDDQKNKEHHALLFFIVGANKSKYSKLIKDIKNDALRKMDHFPKTGPQSMLHTVWLEKHLWRCISGRRI